MSSPIHAATQLLRDLERDPELNETTRRELFGSNIRSLFPEYAWQINEYAMGAEKPVKFPSSTEEDKVVAGRIDIKKGTLIIEYKTKIVTPSEQEKAEDQLKQYIAGVIIEEGLESVTKAISTDVLRWYEYAIALPDKNHIEITPEDVELIDRRSYSFSSSSPDDFVNNVERMVFQEVPLVANGELLLSLFGLKSAFYNDFQNKLSSIWGEIETESEIQLGLDLWSKFLENCFDASRKPDVQNYLDHAYLVLLSRLLSGYAVSSFSDRSGQNFMKTCLNGSFFKQGDIRVANFVEDDFFSWLSDDCVLSSLDDLLASISDQLDRLDFRSAKKYDLLSDVYSEIMPPSHRAEYGEVFTPSWLVDEIIESIPEVKEAGKSFIDPACGTGSFLRSVIVKKIAHLSDQYSDAELLSTILDDICGLDINPISVIITKTTLILTLADLLKSSDQLIQLPVYLCDSLFTPNSVQNESGKDFFVVAVDDEEVEIPVILFENNLMGFDTVMHIINTFAKLAVSGNIRKHKARSIVAGKIGELLPREFASNGAEILESSEKMYDLITKKMEEGRDNVWSFVLTNSYRPSMIKEQFDFMVTNPPWLTLSSLPEVSYKEKLRQMIDFYDLKPSRQSRHHMEIATIFWIHSVRNYLKMNGEFAVILPRVLFNGDHHDPLRLAKFTTNSPISVKSIWDFEDVSPLFKRPACVLKGVKQTSDLGFPPAIPSIRYSGTPPDELEKDEIELYLSRLGDKTFFSYEKFPNIEITESYYSAFREGADIMPRRAVIVDINTPLESTLYSIETAKKEVENSLNKIKVFFRGTIEKKYIFNLFKSKSVLPFATGEYDTAALPVMIDARFQVLENKDILDLGDEHAYEWFSEVDSILTDHGSSLAQRIDALSKLSNQSSEPSSNIVVFGAGGENVTAAVLNSTDSYFPVILDQTVYGWKAPTLEEAYYVCGMLNSEYLNSLIKHCQPKGAFGSQHVHKLPLYLIPKFDTENALHLAVATESQRLESIASSIIEEDQSLMDTTTRLATRRMRFSPLIKPNLDELDRLTKCILDESTEE